MDMKDTILFGYCRKTISTITEPVKMCVTSPPYYGLRDYGGELTHIFTGSVIVEIVFLQSPNSSVSFNLSNPLVLKILPYNSHK